MIINDIVVGFFHAAAAVASLLVEREPSLSSSWWVSTDSFVGFNAASLSSFERELSLSSASWVITTTAVSFVVGALFIVSNDTLVGYKDEVVCGR